MLERLPRQARPWRHRFGLAALWGATAVLSLWGASALSPVAGASHPVMPFCLGTALLWTSPTVNPRLPWAVRSSSSVAQGT